MYATSQTKELEHIWTSNKYKIALWNPYVAFVNIVFHMFHLFHLFACSSFLPVQPKMQSHRYGSCIRLVVVQALAQVRKRVRLTTASVRKDFPSNPCSQYCCRSSCQRRVPPPACAASSSARLTAASPPWLLRRTDGLKGCHRSNK